MRDWAAHCALLGDPRAALGASGALRLHPGCQLCSETEGDPGASERWPLEPRKAGEYPAWTPPAPRSARIPTGAGLSRWDLGRDTLGCELLLSPQSHSLAFSFEIFVVFRVFSKASHLHLFSNLFSFCTYPGCFLLLDQFSRPCVCDWGVYLCHQFRIL